MITTRGSVTGPQIGKMNLFGFGSAEGADFSDVDNAPMVDLNPVPALLSVSALAARLSATFGSNWVLQPQVGGVNTGASLTVLAGQQGANGAVAFDLTQPTVVGDLQTVKAEIAASGALVDAARLMASYSLASPFENWFIIGSGFSTSRNLGSSMGNADFYQAFGANDARIVESQTQMVWPTTMPGTFQHFLAVGIMLSPTMTPTFRARLRIDGATAIEMVASNIASTPFLLLDDATSVHVNGGELVNFATHSDGPYDIDNSTRMLYAVGFLPD